MTVETLQMLSTVAYVLAGIFLLAAIAIFFLLDIRSVIGDVTGATARKAIRDIRAQNEASGNKAYKPSPVNAARGKLTAKISPSGRLEPQMAGMGGSPGTEKLSTMELTAAARLPPCSLRLRRRRRFCSSRRRWAPQRSCRKRSESLPPRSRRRSAHSKRMWRWALAPALRSSSSFYHPSSG